MSTDFSSDIAGNEESNLRINQLQALQRIGVAMASTIRPIEILRMVLEEVSELTHATSAAIYLKDPQKQQLVPKHTLGESQDPRPLDLLSDDDLAVEVAHTGKMQQVSYGGDEFCDATVPSGYQCRVCIPLTAGNDVLGVIDVRQRECQRIAREMEEMLGALASNAAVILRNASVHEELQQHYSELTLLYEIQQEIASTFDYQKVLTLIVARTKRLLNARECTIRLVGENKNRRVIRIAATTGRQFFGPQEVPLSEAVIDQQVFSGDLVYIDDIRQDPRFPDHEEAARAGVVSLLCAPLIARRRIIGTIRLYTAQRREFSLSERKMLLALAGQAAVAIEHARLYTQIEKKNRELLESYDKLRRTQQELVKNEKLAALGEMAATVAHEIRNPLTSIRGFAQRISRRYGKEDDRRLTEYTSIIMEEVDRLNKFIKDVLDFARRVKPQFERVNLNNIISEILGLMRDELSEQRIVVLSDLDMNLRETVLDASLIHRMFLNVLQNARQAMGQKGLLMIKTQNSGNFVRVRICDDGHGIPREILQKIWMPFVTTKTQGTGLGLSLVQRIIEDHRGRILIRSKVGKGTIVDIFLPVIEDGQEYLLPR